MQTLKNTINPAMLKQLSNIAAPPSRVQVNPYIPQRNGAAPEDVYMKTVARHDPKTERERGLQLWEKELLESAEVKRKTTVAQICAYPLYDITRVQQLTPVSHPDFLDYYCQHPSIALIGPLADGTQSTCLDTFPTARSV